MLKPAYALDVFPVRLLDGEPTEVPAWVIFELAKDLGETDFSVEGPAKMIPAGKVYIEGVDDSIAYLVKPVVRVSTSVSYEFAPDEMVTITANVEDIFSATYTRPSFAGERPENQDKVYPFYSQTEMLAVIAAIGQGKTPSVANGIFHYMRDRGLIRWHALSDKFLDGEVRLTELGQREFDAIPLELLAQL